jgi:hypothetical protein
MFPEQLPKRILEEWPEGGDEMEFRLVFRGNLPSERRATVDVKHRIRRELHPQLRMLWQQHPALRHLFEHVPKVGKSRIEQLGDDYAKCGFRFIPLVKKKEFACSLDILLLFRQEPFRAFNRGDLDNRVKTLIDGLRMPDQCSEVEDQSPSEDENPFFVLMDDDSSIFEFQVTTDRLFLPVEQKDEQKEPERNVLAIIRVRVTTFGGNPIAYISGQF